MSLIFFKFSSATLRLLLRAAHLVVATRAQDGGQQQQWEMTWVKVELVTEASNPVYH